MPQEKTIVPFEFFRNAWGLDHFADAFFVPPNLDYLSLTCYKLVKAFSSKHYYSIK